MFARFLRRPTDGARGLSCFSSSRPPLYALLRLLIKRLRDRCGAPLVTHCGDNDLALVPSLTNPKHIPGGDFSGDLDALAVYLDLAALDGGFCQSARFEESCSPEPFIHSHLAPHVFCIIQWWAAPA